MTGHELPQTMRLQRIARFANQHFPPKPTEVRDDCVVIYSEDVYPSGRIEIAEDKVRTMTEARVVLGY